MNTIHKLTIILVLAALLAGMTVTLVFAQPHVSLVTSTQAVQPVIVQQESASWTWNGEAMAWFPDFEESATVNWGS